MRLLQARSIHVRLGIVGAGPDSEELRRSIVDAGVQDCVKMLGPQHGADKERVLEESDVLVFPTYEEGLPYALLESSRRRARCLSRAPSVGSLTSSVSVSAASSCRHETLPQWRKRCTRCIVIARWRVH